MLPVYDADSRHDSRRPGFRKREQRAAVVTSVGSSRRYSEKVFDQSLELALSPAVPTLSAWHHVLNLAVQEFQELDLMGVHC